MIKQCLLSTSLASALATILAMPVQAYGRAPDAPAAASVDASPAPDATAAADPGEITVTARHRSEPLQSVPIAIDAFSTETLDRDGVQNVQDLTHLSPSLNFTKGFSPQDNELSIRGLPGGSGRPPVALLIDGIDTSTQSILTSGGGNLVDLRLLDLERVEVVKGPQSALYGRSAFGGAVNYISKEPDQKLGGYLASEVGLYGRGEVRGAINLPVSDTLAVRFNGVYSTYGGYYTNSVTGNKVGGYEVFGGAFAAKWTPSADFKVLARVSYSDDHEEQTPAKYYGEEDGLASNVALPANLVGTAVGFGKLPATLLEYRPGNVANENVPVAFSADPADPTGHSDYPGAHTYNVLSSLRADWNMGFASLMSLTGYTHSTGRTVSDVDYFGRPLTQVSLPYPGGLGEYSGSAAGNGFWQFDIHTNIAQFSQELRLSHLDSGRLRWAIGGLYWHENVTQLDGRLLEYFGLGANASSSLNVALQNDGRAPVEGLDGRKTDHVSGYGLAEFDILPNLTVSGEGRYAWEKYNYLFGDSVTEGAGNVATGPIPFVLTGAPYSTSATTSYFTPRGIITWKPRPNLMAYISAARGVKPGGISQTGAANAAFGRYLPERLSNYEFGMKGTFLQHRLTVDLAVFHMDYTNMQTTTLIAVPTTVSAQGSLSVTGNAGRATIDGQEIDIAFRATPELTLSANYTHLTPVFKNYILDSAQTFDVIRGGNCTVVTVGSSTTCAISFAGNDIGESLRHSGVATADYLKPIAGDLKAFGEVSVQYHGKSYVDAGNYWTLKARTLVDVKLGLQAARWSVTAYVDNLFDNRTIQNANWLLDVPSGTFGNLDLVAYLPDPRTAGIRMRYNF